MQKTLADYKKDIASGIWFCLHNMAALADHNGTYQEYESFFKHICRTMACNCESHCIEMLGSHPVNKYIKMIYKNGKKCGCLYHSHLCHNLVNRRLGKPEPSFDEVYPLYAYKEEYTPCTAPENLDDLANKFPDLLMKPKHPESNPVKKFRLINMS